MKNQKFNLGSILIGSLVILILIFSMIAMLSNITVSNLDASKINIRRLSAGQNAKVFNNIIGDFVAKFQETVFIVDIAGSSAVKTVCLYSNSPSCISNNIQLLNINDILTNSILTNYPNYTTRVEQQDYKINPSKNGEANYTLKITVTDNNNAQSIDKIINLKKNCPSGTRALISQEIQNLNLGITLSKENKEFPNLYCACQIGSMQSNGICKCPGSSVYSATVLTGRGSPAANCYCPANNYLNSNNCVACPGNAACQNAQIICNSGYYLNGNSCSQCPTGCATCSSSTSCSSCSAGYSLYGSRCQLSCTGGSTYSATVLTGRASPAANCYCPSNNYLNGSICTGCPGNATCPNGQIICNSGYYLNGNSCSQCPTGCATCSSSTSCSSCSAGYSLYSSTCQLSCTGGSSYSATILTGRASPAANCYCLANQYWNGTICTSCPGSSVYSATGSGMGSIVPGYTNCYCLANLAWVNGHPTTGVIQSCGGCPAGTVFSKTPIGFGNRQGVITSAGEVQPLDCYCPASAPYFHGWRCASCPSNATCDRMGAITCDVGYYDFNYTCQKCPAGCATCSYSFYTYSASCLTCSDGYYLNANTCSACATGCATCSPSTNCTSCINGYYLDRSSCSVCPSNAACNNGQITCNSGYYLRGNSCYACPIGCAECSSSLNCSNCKVGYQLVGGVCQLCPNNTWSSGGTSTCQPNSYISCSNSYSPDCICDDHSKYWVIGTVFRATGGGIIGARSFCDNCPRLGICNGSREVICNSNDAIAAIDGANGRVYCQCNYAYYNGTCVQACPSDYYVAIFQPYSSQSYSPECIPCSWDYYCRNKIWSLCPNECHPTP